MADGTLSIKPMSNTQSKHDPGDGRVAGEARTTFDPAAQDKVLQQVHDKVVDEALFLFVTHDVNPRAKSRGALRSRQRKEPYVIALPCRRWLCISLAPNLLSIPSPMVSPPGWRQNCFTTVQFSRNMDYIIKTS